MIDGCYQELQRDIDSHREAISSLSSIKASASDARTKQDVVLVRNLIQNAGRRFDHVCQRCAERTRQLDVGFREANAFEDARNRLLAWISNAATSLAETEQLSTATEPEIIRSQISVHKDFQRSLGVKQSGRLTLSPPIPLRLYTLPYWSNPPFLIFDVFVYINV